jgi:pyruvate/2-oxoglutarate dehydrogenase complex dihydrolipoamide acyltransferase (E2) component
MVGTSVIVPDLGEIISVVRIVAWYKQVGERIAADEDLVELSTDKMDVMIQAPAAGVLAEILVQPGEKVAIGAVLGRIE